MTLKLKKSPVLQLDAFLERSLGDPWLEITRNRLRVRIASIILKNRTAHCRIAEDHVHLCFDIFTHFPLSLFGWKIKPLQIKKEVLSLIGVLQQQKPKNILEIGTAAGGTLYLFARAADPTAMLISVDLPGRVRAPEWRLPYFESFASSHQKIRLIREDSHSKHTLLAIETLLDGNELDFLFIDGDHTYGGVKTDFEMYGNLVREGGLIAFHDIVPGSPSNVGGVPRFWSEIRNSFQHAEFVQDWTQSGMGIGLLHVG